MKDIAQVKEEDREGEARSKILSSISQNESQYTRCWVEKYLQAGGSSFFTYLGAKADERGEVDALLIMFSVIVLGRVITIISSSGVWSTDNTMNHDIVLIHKGGNFFLDTDIVGPGSGLPSESETTSVDGSDTKEVECTLCKVVFKTQLSHTRHLNSCKSAKLICSICDEKLPNVSQLRKHIGDVHPGKLFVCTTNGCTFSFTSRKGLEYHIGNTHSGKEFNCSPCKLSFDTAQELNEHKKSLDHKSRRKPVECSGCKKTYIGKYEAERHFENSCFFNPNRIVKCNICKKNTGPASELLGHLRKVHDSKAKMLCTRCLKEVSSQKKFDKHLKTCKM